MNESSKDDKEEQQQNRDMKIFAIFVLPICFIGLAIWFFLYAPESIEAIIKTHFKAIAGMPIAYVLSLFLVLLFKQDAKPIAFKGLSFEFKGLAGEVILWTVCFLSIVHSIDILW